MQLYKIMYTNFRISPNSCCKTICKYRAR